MDDEKNTAIHDILATTKAYISTLRPNEMSLERSLWDQLIVMNLNRVLIGAQSDSYCFTLKDVKIAIDCANYIIEQRRKLFGTSSDATTDTAP